MTPLSDLDLLARHWGTLFGRALDPDAVPLALGGPSPQRSDRASREIQRALRGLDALRAIANEAPQAAAVLAYVHVVCGPVARQSRLTYAALAVRLGPEKLRRRYPTQEALAAAPRARVGQLAARGLALYQEARAVWDALDETAQTRYP